MDGLLLDTERVGMDVFRNVIAEHGLGAAEADGLYLSMLGKSLEACQAALHTVLPGLEIGLVDAAWQDRVDAAMADGVPLRPTVPDTLEGLAMRGVAMAVVTTTHTGRARHHLERAGILGFFADVVGRDRVLNPKPHPEPYMTGAEALGLRTAACAAFEDSDTGTRAAVAAGCAVWQVPDLRPAGDPPPDLGQRHAGTLAEAVREAGL